MPTGAPATNLTPDASGPLELAMNRDADRFYPWRTDPRPPIPRLDLSRRGIADRLSMQPR